MVDTRATRLSEGWRPSSELNKYAMSLGMDDRQLERCKVDFCDYWIANGGKKIDWNRTYQRWCREQADRWGCRTPNPLFDTPAKKKEVRKNLAPEILEEDSKLRIEVANRLHRGEFKNCYEWGRHRDRSLDYAHAIVWRRHNMIDDDALRDARIAFAAPLSPEMQADCDALARAPIKKTRLSGPVRPHYVVPPKPPVSYADDDAVTIDG